MKRLLWLSLLTVAFFLGGRAQETGHALLMESGGSLSVCNNVVVNNYGGQSNVTTGYNLFGVYNNLFYDKYNNFRVANPVYVYNLGDNSCSLSWLYDLAGNLRISNDTTDLGAFEYAIFVTYPVFQENGGNLTFCNNIIVNNYADTSVNVPVPANNYVTDNDTLFVHPFERFEPRPGTPVLNAGQNSCSTFGMDLRGDDRVMDETVDLGAYERRIYQEPYPVWQETGGGLTFCNNIIINNGQDICMNVSVPAFNYVTDGEGVFVNTHYNFSLLPTSPAVDAGQSSCTTYAQDIMGDERVLGTAIDMGAFELRVNEDRFPVYQEESGSLSFCNNIIVGNHSDTNVNVTLSQYNLTDNSVEVFLNPISNFKLKNGCAAIDAGQNSCSGFSYDLVGDTRVQYEAVDLGAYELRLPVVQYPVLQEAGGTLAFCNNIIINNYSVSNVNVTVPQNNLVTDVPDVFVHEMRNFMLADDSPAENAGDNSCLTFNMDIRGAGRVDGEAVDQGAFEKLHLPQPYAVYQEDNGELQFCNNLIINNYIDSVINVEVSDYNLVGDTTGVLVDDYQDFRLMTGSAAVDAGLNACSTWDNDVNGLLRVQREVVDLGAFELEDVDNGAIVYQESGSELNICNNVIILNSRYTPNTNVEEPSEDNIIDDEVEVFRNVQYDFRPLQQSAAVDAGDNSCNTLLTDLDTVKRISNGTIDIGAFEIPEIDSNYYAGGGGTIVPGDVEDPNFNAVVWERSTASLMLCDNIIAYNDENLPSTNTWYGQDTNYRNIITDEAGIFRFQTSDFRIYPGSPAFNRGRNDCNTLSKDLDKQERIVYDTIDIGAFEYSPYPDVFVVFQKEGHQMTLCNNIIINNNNVFSVNDMNTPSNNLLVDNDLVFMDNSEDYRLREQSPAVNRGDNSCCPLTLDLAEEDRIYADTIDIGAFEYIALTEDTVYVIFHHEGHQLTLCNNIVINNFDTYPTNDPDVSGDNLLVDNDLIFKNNDYDFTLREHAAVVNAGINSCNSLTTDLKDEVRIFGDTIDYGAFEVLSMIEDTSYVVFQKNGHQLQLCNNIIINNADYVYPVNIWDVPSNNMLADNNLIFRDNMSDFRLREQSAAVNVGLNSCNPLSEDMKNDARIYDDIIDLGVFELIGTAEDSVFAVLSKPGHQLLVCNNIIINNVNVENVNIPVDVTNNIIEDSEEVFLNSDFDFRPFRFSQAVNHGNNSCCSLPLDMEGGSRVYEEVIDIGAYEPQAEESDTSFVVFDTDSGSLVICNNIIINNHLAGNLNVEVSAYNIVEDNDTLFRNNVYDFRPFYHTIAVNQGDNACVSWDLDMEMNVRIAEDVVEIGAFELYVDTTNIHYAVFMDGDTLGGGPVDPSQMIRMYNTIVINNPCHTANVSESVVGDHNLLTDVSGVFVEEKTNYTLLIHSPAVDAGDNQWVDWPKDLKDDGRISCANIVDQGAYEYSFLDSAVTVIVSQVPSDNCQGSNFALTALPGAMHYYWSHSNEDTNEVQVSPLSPTDYTVIVTSGGECYDTVTTHVEPSMTMSDSLGSPASVGTTFWLSYLRNHFRAPTLMLNISAEEACSGTVSNPRTGWDTTFSVGAHSVVTVTVPVEEAYPEEADVVGDYGILVQATDSISLYAANYNSSSFDVTVVLPVEALSDEYVLQTYTPMVNAEFIVVAVEDNTVVDITPARALQGGHAAQQTFSVTLQAGQTYFGVSKFGGVLGDLSGTVIQAQDNKPVAVFNGNICALVPTQNSYSDHLVEQAVGVKYWGRSFAITSTESQNFDRVRVTALRNGTEVRKNGTLLTTLQAFQTYEFQLSGTEGSCYLETTNPVGVYLYIAGAVQGNPEEKSDPSMVWIPPTEQMLMDVTFATFDSPGIVDHYVNIVVPAGSVQEVMLDGVHIGNQFTLLNGSSNYAFLRKQITNGTHSLQCEGGFIAHCYGLGFHESYGYATGSKAVPLKEQLFVNGIPSNELPPDMRFCPYEPIPLSVYVNYPCDSIVWDFGDNTPTVNAYETVHDYAGAGHYSVSATLYITSNGTVFCSNMYAWVNVDEGTTVTIHETICQGESYQQYGFDIQGDVSGHRTETRKVLLEGEYCDSTYVLELDILNSYFIVSDTICAQNNYSGYGFDITPMEPGVVEDTINVGEGSTGCDSLVILQLVVTPNNDMLPVIEGETYPCMGGEYTYSIDPLSGLQDVVWTVPDSLIVIPGQDPYSITLLFGAYAESMEICVSAMGGCGDLQWCKTIYPQDYKFVQLTDTICSGTTEYSRFGFELTDVSDSNDLFINHNFSSGGCDSTTVLRLVFLSSYEKEDSLYVCDNNYPYSYYDSIIPGPGVYSLMLTSALGCDSLVTLTVVTKPAEVTIVDSTVCDSITWIDGVTYFTSVDTSLVLMAASGCDSVVTLHLTVNHSSHEVANETSCGAFTWHDVTYQETGIYFYEYENTAGCLSKDTLHLTINQATSGTDTQTACDSYTWIDDVTYTESTNTPTVMLTNAAGCDSVVTLNLTINHANTFTDTQESCDSYTWIDDVTYTESTNTPTVTLTNAAGCDSVVTLNLTINHATTFTDTQEACDSYTWINGETYTESTDTPTVTLTNAAGCDSVVTLNLTINHATTFTDTQESCDSFTWINGETYTESTNTPTVTLTNAAGCDSVVTLHLTINHSSHNSFTETAYDTYTWTDGDGVTYNQSGTYTYTYTNDEGCESVDTLHLTVYYSSTNEFAVIACESYEWDGRTYTTSGDHEWTYTDQHGADSTVIMHLTINHGTYTAETVTACDSYSWNGMDYTVSGTYTYDYTNDQGCPSADTLHLTINYATASFDTIVACDSYTWIDGVTYTESTDTPTYTLTNAAGCDSVVTLNLTINHSTVIVDTINACDSFTWIDGETYTESTDTPTVTLTNAAGCDSVVTLNLTINHATTFTDTQTACDSYTWINGETYAESTNTPTVTLTNAAGCDSVVTLHLTVNHATHNAYTEATCGEYEWHDTTYSESGTYLYTYTNDEGCESVDTLHLTIIEPGVGETSEVACDSYDWYEYVGLTESGDYTRIITLMNGCDSIVTLHLTINHSTHNSYTETAYDSYTWTDGDGVTYNQSGTYTYTYTNEEGCESVDTLHLTVHYSSTNEFSAVACESYEWDGRTYTTSGDHEWTYTDQHGADSTVIMHLTINHGTHNVTVRTLCEGYEWHDSMYTETGVYLYTYTNDEGCESVDTLHLTINEPGVGEVSAVACDSYDWYEYEGLTESGDYTRIIPGDSGCDSVVTLHLTINHSTHNTFTETACGSYDWHGTTYTESGDYTYAYMNEEGCESMDTLHLTINHATHNAYTEATCGEYEWHDTTYSESGTYLYIYTNDEGCESVDTLHLTINEPGVGETSEVACDSYDWYEYVGLTESGDYTRIITLMNGCDSIVTLHLTINHSSHNSFTETAYDSYTWTNGDGMTYNQSGTYTYTYTNEEGCESVDTLHLTVYYSSTNEFAAVACESYEWDGRTYTTSGDHEWTYTDQHGADSTVIMHLTINHGTHNVTVRTLCEGYEWHDSMYTETGVYLYTYTNDEGCESVDTLHLTIIEPGVGETSEVACDSYDWYEYVGLTESGDYTRVIPGDSGCDSVVTLHLTINHSTHNSYTETACGSYDWHGTTYTESGDYTYAYMNEEGCESMDTLHLTVNHATHNAYTEATCGEYDWHDTTYSESGTYLYIYTNDEGCESVDTLHLTIIEPGVGETSEVACDSYDWYEYVGLTESGDYTRIITLMNGCDSIVTLHLTINHSTHNSFTETAYDSYTWTDGDGATYNQSGTYTYTYTNEEGCESVDTLHLTVYYSSTNEFSAVACESYEWDGRIYTTSGDYEWTYTGQHGADSVVTLHLTINHGTHTADSITTCDSYTWHGTAYTTSGTYTYDYTNDQGCSSTDTLHLTINYATSGIDSIVACDTFTWINGETYTESTNIPTYTLTNAAGCDSIVTLHLTINHGTHTANSITACDSYTWHGTAYTTSGTYTYDYTNDQGCLSTDTLHLTINYATSGIDSIVACDSFTWINGETYTESTNIPTYTLTNATGCDSVVTLNLTINHATASVDTIVACDTFTWINGETYTESTNTPTYTLTNAAGCDSVVTLNLTINHTSHNSYTETAYDSYTWTDGDGVTYNQSGTYTYTYTNEEGCESVDTLHLTVYYSSTNEFAAVACESYEWDGRIYTTSGDHEWTYTDQYGADSVVTMHLTINHGTHTANSITACDSYTWHGTAYATTGTYTYEYTNDQGCSSTDTLHLTINYATAGIDSIMACDTFTWINGETYTESTNTPTYTLTNATGCDSVVTLNLTINHSTHHSYTETAYDSYTWTDGDGMTYNQSGTYTYTYTNDEGCESVDTLHLTVYYSSTNEFAAVACESYEWDGRIYTTSGDHEWTYTDQYGADSVVTMHLTINHGTYAVDTVTACNSYTWHGMSYTTGGTYTYDYTNDQGCSSTDTLHLTINYATTSIDTIVACDSYTWINGETYTESTNIPTYTLTNAAGCDSVVTLNLTINHSTHNSFTETAYDSYTWTDGDGVTYNQSGTYTYTYTNDEGCESVDTLHLTVYYSSTNEFAAVACESYEWDGRTYTTSGDHEWTYTDQHGADSVVTMHLTINHGTHTAETITTCDSYTWHGTAYTTSGTYTYDYTNDQGCSSTDTLHLTINYATTSIDTIVACDSYTWINGETYTESTNIPTYTLTNAAGCDSVVTLNLTINHSFHNSFTETVYDSYTWTNGDGVTYNQSGTYTYTYTNDEGCESVDTLHLTVYYSSTNEFTAVACESYEWDGRIYTTSGDHEWTYTDQYGADSVVTMHLTINHGTHTADSITTCDSYTWHGTAYTTSGTYTYDYTNDQGCSSTDTLHLTINHATTGIDSIMACDTFTWINGETYTESTNIPTFTLTNSAGCDSVVTLNLTINHATSGIDSIVACDSFTWINGETYTESTNIPTYTLTNATGCDSVVTLHLTINHSSHNSFTETAYDSYTWTDGDGVTYNQSGTYTYAYTNNEGCESVDTLHLTVYYSSINEFAAVACESYEWDGRTYTTSGDHEWTYTDQHGADSVVTMHLTINHGTHTADSITTCDSYTWHVTAYTTSGTYTYDYTNDQGCSSTDTLHLTINHATSGIDSIVACDSITWINGETYTESTNIPTYTLTNATGCDSVVTLNLTINHATSGIDSIVACDSFTWINGETYTESTNIPTYTLTNAAGCDSVVTLHLTINHSSHNSFTETAYDSYTWTDGDGVTYNQSGTYTYTYTNEEGCESVDTLHLTVYYSSTNEFAAVACESYEWDGRTYTTSGDHEWTYTDQHGADSVVTMHLTINHGTNTAETITTCDSYTWHGTAHTTSGTYTYDYMNDQGCSSTDTLHLTVNYATSGIDSIVACDSYTWINGETYTESTNIPTYTLTNATGCDSVVTLNLTINHATASVDTIVACDTFTWINGETYTESTNIPTFTLTNAAGCDSVVTLHLTINHSSHNSFTETAYDSYTWTNGDGVTYNQSGTYTYTYTNDEGCESVDTLHLTVYYSSTNEFADVACESYEWDGRTYTTSGDHEWTYTDQYGADSVVTLHLTINHGTHFSDTITACDSYTWHGTAYDTSGMYTYDYTNDQGCSSTDTLHLTINYATTSIDTIVACDSYTWINGVTYTESTSTPTFTLTNAAGCDSVVTLNLTINHATAGIDTIVACDSYTWINGVTYTESTNIPTFTLTNATGCDSVVTLNLTINHGTHISDTITACDSYTWHGTAYATSGMYTYDYTNDQGCSSTDTLHLTINYATAGIDTIVSCDSYIWINGVTYTESTNTPIYTLTNAAGCDSVVTLNLIINHATAGIDTIVACDSITWINGETYTESTNTPTYTLTNATGCDSVVTLNLTINHSSHNSFTETAYDSYTWTDGDGVTYNQSGTYTYTYTNDEGCESVDTLHLTVYYSSTNEFAAVACESYEWDGRVYTTSGDHEWTYTDQYGADSVVTLHLTINHGTHFSDTITACDSYTWHGTAYATSGMYTYDYTNDQGCSSTDTLHLTINYATTSIDTIVACDSYTWINGVTYTESTSTPTFTLTNAAGCDSVVTLNLTINHATTGIDTIVACDSITWINGVTYTESTNIPTFTLTNATGCDSVVTLNLTINHGTHISDTITACDSYTWHGTAYATSGMYTYDYTNDQGCSSTDTLHLTINYATTSIDTIVACDSITWIDGVTYTESTNIPTYTLTNAAGCDSVVTLNLTINHSSHNSYTETAYDTFTWTNGDGVTYNQSGTYTYTYTNEEGCESVDTLRLTVHYSSTNEFSAVACESYEWDGRIYTTSGDHEWTYTDQHGADSVVTMHLTINHATSGIDSIVACDTFTWINGETYTESTNIPAYTLTNAAGCDSVVTLHLTINHATSGIDSIMACDSFTWINGETYTESTNIPTYTLTNAAGCDSVVTLHLTINHATSGIDSIVTCDTFTWINGETYTESTNVPTYTLTNAAGCDSVVTLNLTINHETASTDTIVACDTFTWINGETYTESTNIPTYTLTNAAGCDSVVTLNLTINYATTSIDSIVACDSITWINGVTYTESTNTPTYTLTNAAGCDSVVTLNLTINHATSGIDSIVACDSITWINGETYTESTNIPTYTLTNAAGCDSVVTLNLTINHSTHTSDTITACDSITWMDGVTYTESTNTPTFTLTNAAGCDSVVTLNLTINHGTHNVETITACGGYEWHDTTYSESGTYTYAYTNEGGCESVDTLHLTMGQSGAIDTSVVACESFDWYEHIGLTVSGDYTHTITSVNGCDTLVTLHLTVLTATDTVLYATVVENSLPYIFHNLVCNTTGIYVDTIPNSAGCDSILTLNLTVLYNVTSTVDTTVCANDMPYTWHGHQFTAAGSYTVTLPASSGVDSVVTYTLIVNDLSASAGNITHVVCYGDSTGAATATVSGGQTPLNYQWINAMGETISTTTSITNRPAGVYTFTATDHLGCTATVTVTMNTLNADMVAGTISADQEVCEGENVPAFTGTAASGGENATYQWQISTDGVNWTAAPGAATAQGYTYPDPATTDFMLRRAWVSQSCGTVYSNTVTVVVWPNTFDTITAVVCMGEPYQENGFDITAEQNADAGEYSYDLHYPTDHCDSVVVLMLTVLPQSTYILEEEVCEGAGYSANGFEVLPSETVGATYLERVLTLQGANGCDSVVYLHLTITDTSLQIVTLSEDFCDYQEAELLAVTNLTNYSWSTGETTPNITVTMPGYYSVTAYQGECSSSAMVLVEGCTGDFMLPNAITPSNGDGQNDYFCIPESQRQNIALFEIYVYNRWGELVYYSNDKNFSWNGEYRGSIQYQTIYNYVITYTELSGKPHRKVGSVIIL